MFLPEGSYTMHGYNGHGNNLLVDVPPFRVEFDLFDGKPSEFKVLSGGAKIEPYKLSAADKIQGLATFRYGEGKVAFEPNTLHESYVGEHPFALRFQGADGKPYRGSKVLVSDNIERGTYIYYGKMPADGSLDLGKIKPGNYRITVDGHTPPDCASLQITEESEADELKIEMPIMPGYSLESLHLLDPESLAPRNIKDYRGKVVYIELWASWCGPCIAAMNAVESTVSEHRDEWGDKVALVAVNVDKDPQEMIEKFVDSQGWTSFEHLYGGDKDKTDYDAPVLRQLQLMGIPHALIVGPDGKLVWRGHPSTAQIDKIIGDLLKTEK